MGYPAEIVAFVTMVYFNHDIDGLINLANDSLRLPYMTRLLHVFHDLEHNGHWKPLSV